MSTGSKILVIKEKGKDEMDKQKKNYDNLDKQINEKACNITQLKSVNTIR